MKPKKHRGKLTPQSKARMAKRRAEPNMNEIEDLRDNALRAFQMMEDDWLSGIIDALNWVLGETDAPTVVRKEW
jgi:hypothetical protein